jgi:2-methylcitrate dehydratase PrpD
MNALGIADYHSPSLPLMRDVDEPAMVKHGIGLGPMTGLMSAELAARGFTGITSLLSDEKYQDWVGDIGTHFILPKGISWKDYACCAWSHPALIGFKRLMAEHNFSAEQISRIIVEVYEEASHLGVNLPDTTEQAQFNLAWPIAALMVDGEVGPNQVLEKRLTDEQIRAIARKVEISVSAELTHFYELSERMDPEGVDASRVILELNDGRKLESGLAVTPPYVEQNWDRSRMERKFRWLLAEIIPKPVVDKLVEMVWGFDQVQDVGELSEIISKLKLFPH